MKAGRTMTAVVRQVTSLIVIARPKELSARLVDANNEM
jgi:hypothetical protein